METPATVLRALAVPFIAVALSLAVRLVRPRTLSELVRMAALSDSA